MTIKLVSFGYRNGLPADADLVIDVRCLPNPYYVEELKTLNGLQDPVYNYVFSFDQSKTFVNKITDFLSFALPHYYSEGKTELIIGVGCTSGHHRSVAVVRYLLNHLGSTNYRVLAMHRDIEKAF